MPTAVPFQNPAGGLRVKAAVLYGPMDVRIEDVPEPELAPGGAIVRIRACAICGSDTMMYRGDHPYSYPAIMGHEAAGEVVAVADDVQGVKVGDRITFWCHYGCFAEYACVPTAKVAIGHLADSVTFEQGANTQLLCAIMRGVECAELRGGERVLVVGQGPVGLMTLQGAKAKGAGTTVGTDLCPNRIAMSERLGADLALDGASLDWPDVVRDQVGEVDVVLDCMMDDQTPDRRAVNQAMGCLRSGGKYVMIGQGTQPRALSALTLLSRLITVVPSHQPMERVRAIMDRCCAWVADGAVDVTTFVTHRLPLGALTDGFDLAMNHQGEAIKVMVTI